MHIAGTKGKGSTCAFVRSFLQVHGLRTGFPQNVGLYTSPDLRGVRERIQINDNIITEELFTRYFYEVWERLDMSRPGSTISGDRSPRFLQLMTLLAFHTFIKEGTDATIVETHHGGEFDATNFIKQPVVTAVTPIGMDHVAQLGPTIENIAWHKAGIFKSGALAYSASQDWHVKHILQQRALEKNVDLKVVEAKDSLSENAKVLEISVQRQNCSLALEIANGFLEKTSPTGHRLSEHDVAEGVQNFNWPGRFQIIPEGKNTWYVDGAHNNMSVEEAAIWFSKTSTTVENNDSETLHSPTILIFTHLSEKRDGLEVLRSLAGSLKTHACSFHHIVFTTFDVHDDGKHGSGESASTIHSNRASILQSDAIPDPAFNSALKTYTNFWEKSHPGSTVVSKASIYRAIDYARHVGQERGTRTLITGSLHLVGGALRILSPIKYNNCS